MIIVAGFIVAGSSIVVVTRIVGKRRSEELVLQSEVRSTLLQREDEGQDEARENPLLRGDEVEEEPCDDEELEAKDPPMT